MAAQNGRAQTRKSNFSRETSISTRIDADQAIIRALLINASDHPRWNSTIVSIEETIAAGEKISLRPTPDPKRTFKLNISEPEPGKKLVWDNAMGRRAYTFTRETTGTTFTMTEKTGGPLFPLFAKMIPPFDQSF